MQKRYVVFFFFFFKGFMSCVLNICGMGLNVSCEEACLQINPGDVPWYLLSFHTRKHMQVSLDENRWFKEKRQGFLQVISLFNVESSRPGSDPHGPTDPTTCFMCARTDTLSIPTPRSF